MKKAVYYHAGCPVCVNAEDSLLNIIDASAADLEIVHLGEQKSRIDEAERMGVKSVPALAIEGNVLHINYGAGIEDLK